MDKALIPCSSSLVEDKFDKNPSTMPWPVIEILGLHRSVMHPVVRTQAWGALFSLRDATLAPNMVLEYVAADCISCVPLSAGKDMVPQMAHNDLGRDRNSCWREVQWVVCCWTGV
jgi:hypothetical protein